MANKDSLISALKAVRDGRKNNRKQCARNILECLKYKNHSYASEEQLDTLLIWAVDEHFGHSVDADILLMAFGLLDGYHYDQLDLGKRREKYLIDSNVMQIVLKVNENYSTVSPERQGQLRSQNLRKAEDKRISELADFLVSYVKRHEIESLMRNLKKDNIAKLHEPSYLLFKNKADAFPSSGTGGVDQATTITPSNTQLDIVPESELDIKPAPPKLPPKSDPPKLEPPEPEPEPEPEPDPVPDQLVPEDLPKRTSKKKFPYMLIAIIVLSAVIVIIVLLTTQRYNPDNPPSAESSDSGEAPGESLLPVSLNKLAKQITDAEMESIINEARAPIAVYDESGDYNIDAMKTLIYERIINNPIYGDMVVRGLLESDSIVGGELQDNNPEMRTFVEDTDSAMENPEFYQEGMRKWLIKTYHIISPTDEYKDFADELCNILAFYSPSGVSELNSTARWYLEPNTNGIYARSIRDSQKTTQRAMVLCHQGSNGRILGLIGFVIDDGSVVICDPWEIGLDAFTE